MRRAVRWGVLATLVTGALLASVPAAADDVGTREAKRRFDEGITRTQSGDWEGARLSFRQSIAAAPSQNALFNLALAEEKCARPLEALSHFKQYMEWHSLNPSERAQAQRHIADLSAKTGHLDIQAPAGTVFGLDAAKDMGTTPLPEPLDVVPGRHTVVVKVGQQTKSVDVDAAAGQVTHVAFKADEPAPIVPPPPPAPVVAPPPPAVEAPMALAASPTMTSERPTPTSGASTARIATVASMGGVAVLAGVAGLYFGQQSNSDADSANTLRAQNPVCAPNPSAGCQHLQDVINSAHTEHVTSDVLFVTSGALAVVALGTWALWPTSRGDSAATSVRMVPALGLRGAGVMAVGDFRSEGGRGPRAGGRGDAGVTARRGGGCWVRRRLRR